MRKLFFDSVFVRDVIHMLKFIGLSSSIHSCNEILPFYLSLLKRLTKASISTESGWDLYIDMTLLKCYEYFSTMRFISNLVINPRPFASI